MVDHICWTDNTTCLNCTTGDHRGTVIIYEMDSTYGMCWEYTDPGNDETYSVDPYQIRADVMDLAKRGYRVVMVPYSDPSGWR